MKLFKKFVCLWFFTPKLSPFPIGILIFITWLFIGQLCFSNRIFVIVMGCIGIFTVVTSQFVNKFRKDISNE